MLYTGRKRMIKVDRSQGFSLIELLVVLVI
ncbi:MAG: prepilin-type N-terminal cleavage/methylation domain-containing protein, partial [Wenzhouxiangella sp.]